MAVTRQSLCSFTACPEPSNPDWHVCVICGARSGDHQHVQKRSARPDLADDPNNIVFLCREHHELIDNNGGWNEIGEADGQRYYMAWDFKGNMLCNVPIGTYAPPMITTNVDDFMSVLTDYVTELRRLPEESLQHESQTARVLMIQYWVRHCATVYVLRDRYRGQRWEDHARNLFGYAPSTLRSQAKLIDDLFAYMTEYPHNTEFIPYLSDRQIRVVARARDFAGAMNEALNYYAETERGEPEGLTGRLQAKGLLEPSHYTYECPACAHVGQLREFRKEGQGHAD